MFENFLAVKAALLHTFPNQRVLVVGDLMLDRYLWGNATRISPEAPVPVVRLARRTVALGGAANVARNLRALGVQAELAGFVGCDPDADELRKECSLCGIGCESVVGIEDFPTITKTRIIADDRQMLRIDEEMTAFRLDQDADLLLGGIRRELDRGVCAVILSDYAKGACTPYLCQRLIALCRDAGVPVYVDPKGRDYAKYAGATAIKPNRVEMIELAEAMGWPASSAKEAAIRLRETLDTQFVALTLGSEGIVVVQEDGTHEIPTVAKEVFDVSGAGDTVIATMVAGLSSGLPVHDSVALANLAAAVVIGKIGTSPIAREDLLMAVQSEDRSLGVRKLYALDELKIIVDAWRAQGLKVAFTNGCFDLLHAGHVRLLEDSAALADRLVVGLNSDDSISRLKGAGRPLMPVQQRVGVLAALEAIDAVTVFEEDTPLNVIDTIHPDMLIKGGDYTVETVVGADVVQAYGGKVMLVPLVEGISTSRLAAAIGKL